MRRMGKKSATASGSVNVSSPIPPVTPSLCPSEPTLTQVLSQQGQQVPSQQRQQVPSQQRQEAPSQQRLGQPAPSEQAEEVRSYNPQIDHMKDIHTKKRLKNTKKRLKHVVEPDKSFETRVEDVAWLCSLSESEMDILISVKQLIIQRAKMIGCKDLANKFSLKMIRAIALVLMEHLKTEIKDSSLIPNMVKSTAFLDACNLLKCNNEVDANIDELSTSLGADIQKLLTSPSKSKRKKQKVESSE